MNFLKILIPSWRFFDRAGDVTELYARSHSGNSRYSHWEKVLKVPPRHLGNLFLNPQGNLYLAGQGLVDRLVQEISEDSVGSMTAEFIEHQTGFMLVKNLVEHHLKNQGLTKFQFMIKVIPASGAAPYEALVSEEYPL